ncbi:MAG: hydrogenase 3 maturation endopeptidase HyCI [candidate division WOR-3 bacterium]
MGKILIVGVGNRLRCDDGVGSHIVDLLKERVKDVEVIDAGTVPENYLESIIQKRPQRVLIVDACLFDGKPGEFRLFDLESFENLHFPNFSTHTLPLNLIAQLIITKTNAKVYLLGIQPAQRGFGEKLSPVLSATLPKILNYIEEWILAPI